jgi:uncharacterized protein
MVQIDTVLLKIASRCNLDCRYCYVYRMADDGWKKQPKRMSIETISAVAHHLENLGGFQQHRFKVVFHGGEPLLVGSKHLTKICRILRSRLPEGCCIGMQTNGVLLSDEIISICAEWNVSIAISIDGPASVNDRHRVDRRGRGTHERVMTAAKRLLNHSSGKRLFSGVLAVIDLSSSPEDVYQFLKSTGAPSIDFLYRDGNHDLLPVGKHSLISTEYGQWLGRLLDYYLADESPTPIRIFDEMIKSLIRSKAVLRLPTDEPGIVIVDTDGSIRKNDILKSAYKGADTFASQWSILRDDLVDVLNSREFRDYQESQKPSGTLCQTCPELDVCRGGIPAHRWSLERGFANVSVFCADQRYLATLLRKRLHEHGVAVA